MMRLKRQEQRIKTWRYDKDIKRWQRPCYKDDYKWKANIDYWWTHRYKANVMRKIANKRLENCKKGNLLNWGLVANSQLITANRPITTDNDQLETNYKTFLMTLRQWCGSGLIVSGSGSTQFDQSGSRSIKSQNFQNIF